MDRNEYFAALALIHAAKVSDGIQVTAGNEVALPPESLQRIYDYVITKVDARHLHFAARSFQECYRLATLREKEIADNVGNIKTPEEKKVRLKPWELKRDGLSKGK